MITLVKTYVTLLQSVKIQKRYLKESIKPELDAFLQNHAIDQIKIDKIHNYYGMGVPALLGLLYALPRNYPINNTERYAMTYLGALTGIIDDAFDEAYIEVSRVHEYIQNQSSFVPRNSPESLMVFLGTQVLKYLPSVHHEAFWETAKLVFKQQQISLMQQHSELDTAQLLNITREKGGWPFVLYRYCLETPIDIEEQTLIFEIGASMQLGNDIFDVYKDLQQKIKTVPNTIPHIKNLEIIFHKWIQISVNQLFKVNFTNLSARRNFLEYYLLGMSRCIVCMEQFLDLERQSGDLFIPYTYTRKQLICDMEKWSNIWKSIQVFKTLKKKYMIR